MKVEAIAMDEISISQIHGGGSIFKSENNYSVCYLCTSLGSQQVVIFCNQESQHNN